MLSSMKPLKPMEVSPFLEASAMDHASDLIINNRFSDDGSDGSTLSDRMERYCVWRGTNGENIVSLSSNLVSLSSQLILAHQYPGLWYKFSLGYHS